MNYQRSQTVRNCHYTITLACLVVFILTYSPIFAQDWATYRHDGKRSGTAETAITPPLSLCWTFQPMHAPKPAWPLPSEELPRLHIDAAHHVVTANGKAYFGSPIDNKVYALDMSTGQVAWAFFTEGPVRFAPVLWQDRIFFGSDDGYVYCLQAKDAKLIWKYRAGPTDEKILGNGSMISLWPVRTGMLIDDGVLYATAGVFPYEGIYITALDAGADVARILWKNDTVGDRSHELDYGGICPHGYLVASEDVLYVPSGRAMPAAFDKRTGQFISYLSSGGKVGGIWALVSGDELIAGVDRSGRPAKVAFDGKTGRRKGDAYAWFPGVDMVATSDISYTLALDGIKAISRGAYPHLTEKLAVLQEDQKKTSALLTDLRAKLADVDERMRDEVNRQIDEATQRINDLAQQEEANLKDLALKWQYDRKDLHTLVLTGNTLFAGGEGTIIAVNASTGKEIWSSEVAGTVFGITASSDGLVVTTDRGLIYCFGEGEELQAQRVASEPIAAPYKDDPLSDRYQSLAASIISETGVKKGYCLVLDSGTGGLAYALAQHTDLNIIGIEQDTKKVEQAKRVLDAAGMYGSRVVIESWDLASLPDYFANLIVSQADILGQRATSLSQETLRVLRPYGGVAYVPVSSSALSKTEYPHEIQSTNLAGLSRIVRGPLEGAGAWTEEYANPQGTACSGDDLARTPLGVLWFGDPGSEQMPDRHSKWMSPVAMNGRLFVQGEEVIMAYDAYNGTLLWERKIPGAVRPRVDADGGNLTLTEDSLYVVAHAQCYRLNVATGEIIRTFEVPRAADGSEQRWGYVTCTNGVLYGSRTTPLKRDYFALWNALVKDGAWVDSVELPPEYQDAYDRLRATYDVPDERVLASIKQSGAFWRGMADFPRWENYSPAQGAVTANMMVSDMVFGMDPATGDLLWQYDGGRIAHITLTVGDGRIYFTDSAITQQQRKRAIVERQELAAEGIYREADVEVGDENLDVRNIVCLNAVTGDKLWEKPVDLTDCGGDILGSAYQEGVLLLFAAMGSHDAWRHQRGTLTWKRITALAGKDGRMLWSHPNNYRTRPVVVGDTIFIEPRACDLHTGEIRMRTHPITGERVPWEYLRPGHTCAISGASAHTLFYRSYSAAFYDFTDDSGLTLFGGIRPNCWINMISASGLVLMPEGSAGCTCSFPLRGSLVLTHKPQRPRPWNVFITHGETETAQHFAINLGAPGDMKDSKGTLWFAYPNPRTSYAGNHYPGYGVKFDLHDQLVGEGMGYFRTDFKGMTVTGTKESWLFASGCLGLSRCDVPLIEDTWEAKGGVYTVRLGFSAPSGDKAGQRVFDVKLQGKTVLAGFDIIREAGTANKAVIREFTGIDVQNDLTLELVPKAANPTVTQAPLLNFIEVSREDIRPDAEEVAEGSPLSDGKAETLLVAAKSALKDGDVQQALNAYHTVLQASSANSLKLQALEGITSIGSPESLARLAWYCKDLSPIVRDYREPDAALKVAATKAYLAIAENTVKTNPQKGIRMLNEALEIAGEDLRPQVVASLQALGIEVEKQ